MSRRSFLVAVGLVLLLLVGGGGTLVWLLTREQEWYTQAAPPPGPERERLSKEVYRELSDLYQAVTGDDHWQAHFTDQQINSYIDEDFVHSGLRTRILPENVSQPRVAFESNRVRLAFRYGSGSWSTLISIDLGIWLIRSESAVALELEGIHAGALPFSAQSLLERISESEYWQQNGVEVTWYRHPENGHPVAVIRFQAQPFQLDALQLEKGSITIRGRSGDLAATLRTMLQPLGPKQEAAQ
jgi:hypothetical protein